MAETEEVMTFEDASARERLIQLGDPDEVTLPDGRTVTKAREEFELQAREEGKLQAERDLKAMRRETSAELPDVVMDVAEGGGVVTKPVAGEDDGTEKPPAHSLPEGFPHIELLVGAGFTSLGSIAAASDAELLAIDGVGEARLKDIREAAGES